MTTSSEDFKCSVRKQPHRTAYRRIRSNPCWSSPATYPSMWLIYLPACPFTQPSTHPSSTYPPTQPSNHPHTHWFTHSSTHLPNLPSTYLPTEPSNHTPTHALSHLTPDTHLPTNSPTHLPPLIYPSIIYLHMHPTIHPPTHPSNHLPTHPPSQLPTHSSIQTVQPVCDLFRSLWFHIKRNTWKKVGLWAWRGEKEFKRSFFSTFTLITELFLAPNPLNAYVLSSYRSFRTGEGNQAIFTVAQTGKQESCLRQKSQSSPPDLTTLLMHPLQQWIQPENQWLTADMPSYFQCLSFYKVEV